MTGRGCSVALELGTVKDGRGMKPSQGRHRLYGQGRAQVEPSRCCANSRTIIPSASLMACCARCSGISVDGVPCKGLPSKCSCPRSMPQLVEVPPRLGATRSEANATTQRQACQTIGALLEMATRDGVEGALAERLELPVVCEKRRSNVDAAVRMCRQAREHVLQVEPTDHGPATWPTAATQPHAGRATSRRSIRRLRRTAAPHCFETALGSKAPSLTNFPPVYRSEKHHRYGLARPRMR